MTGIDVFERMLGLAQDAERDEPLGIRYARASFSDLAIFADASFDAVGRYSRGLIRSTV